MEKLMIGSRMSLDTAEAQEALDNYMSSLADLTVNSKPHINALTMLAEDYYDHAEAIVRAVDDHLKKVPSNVKLPVLYLIDSIIKNVRKNYIGLFSRIIVPSFCSVFEQVDETTRQQMYRLRQTWNDIFSQEDLYQVDVKVHALDPGWPITAVPAGTHKIHVNPKFFHATTKAVPASVTAAVNPVQVQDSHAMEAELREQLLQKKKGLLQLQQERVDLELSQMKAKLVKKSALKINEKNILEESTIIEKEKEAPPAAPLAHKKVSVPEISAKENAPAPKDVLKKIEKTESLKKDLSAQVPVKVDKVSQEPQVTHSVTTTTRIAPVSSGLVNLVASQRSQRDPRLIKPGSEQTTPSEESSKSNSKTRDPRLSVKADNRSKSAEKESSSRSRSMEKEQSRSRSSEKDPSRSRSSEKESSRSRSSEKEAASKSSRHRSRDSSLERSSRSRRDEKEKRPSDRKTGRKSEERSSPRLKKSSNHSPSKSSSKRERRRVRSRSPRQSNRNQHRAVSDCADSQDSDGGVNTELARERGKSPHAARAPQPPTTSSPDWPVNYTKGTHKRRNYMTPRRQESPEAVASSVTSDVDLRVGGPPEKQSRLSDAIESSLSASVPAGVPDQILPTIACQDVDLRCLPSSPGKKRHPSEPEEGPPPNKKNKAAYMEMLFGNQDVDLRQMDSVKVKNGVDEDAPSPPPPPIISTPSLESQIDQDSSRVASHGWSKFKQTMPGGDRSPPFPRSTRNDRLVRSFGEKEDRSQNEDTDMRLSVNGYGGSKPDLQAILARASEQYKNGTMSHADYTKVQQQVFRMNESEKLKEAQRNEYSRRDAWERRPVKERDYRHGMGSPNSDHFGDIDERYPKTPAIARANKKPLLPLPPVPPVQPRDDLWEDCGPPAIGGVRMPGPYGRQLRPHRGLLRTPGPASWRSARVGPHFKDNTIPLPPADPHILERIAQDPMKTITIDSMPREIRFYGEDAVVFLSGDDPREIAFDPGEANIILDDVLVLHAAFHEPAKEVNFGGKIHRVRLGAPTRELYIDDEGFECQFNRPPIKIILRTGEVHLAQLQSEKAPMVHVGRQRRDLVAGRIMLVIDAEYFIPIFLDAKPQRFDIDGMPHIMKFADALRTVLVNNHPFNIDFGGPPVPITVRNRRHYIRLTELPPGVVPGEVDIISMSGIRGKAHARSLSPSVSAMGPGSIAGSVVAATLGPSIGPNMGPGSSNDHEPALPARAVNRGVGKKIKGKMPPRRDRDHPDLSQSSRSEDRQMPADLYNAIQPGLPSLLGLLPGNSNSGYNCAPTNTTSLLTSTGGLPAAPSAADNKTTSTDPAPSSSSSQEIPLLGTNLNMDELFQRLIATGIVSSISSMSDSKKDKEKEEEEKKKINEVDFRKSETLKIKQPGIVDLLYSGIQCSSCGTRFPPEQTVKYSQHLDWHFRQNRRDKDSARKPQSRKWYYYKTDWNLFEEIEDMEEKGQNWFDAQQGETIRDEEPEDVEIHSVPANEFPEGAICELCHDKFEQFFNEEKEEWHLRHCMKVEEHVYHPLCYKDYRASLDSNEGIQVNEEEKTLATSASESDEQAVDLKGEEAESNDNNDNAAESGEVKEKVEESEEANSAEKVPDEESLIKESVEEVDLKTEQDECEASTPAESVEIKKEPPDELEKEPEENAVPTSVEGESTIEEKAAIKQEPLEDTTDVEAAEETSKDLDAEESKAVSDVEEKGEAVAHAPVADTTHASVPCSIDGNVELAQTPSTLPSAPAKIKINISKPVVPKPTEDNTEDKTEEEEIEIKKDDDNIEEPSGSSEPPPPGEELIVLKPKLMGRKLSDLPPVMKGTEISGLCSIM